MIDLKTMRSHRNLPKNRLAAGRLTLFVPGLSAVPCPGPVEGDRRCALPIALSNWA